MNSGRKKHMTVKIILIAAAVLLIAGFGVLIKVKYEQSKMNPPDTGEIIPDIYAVRCDFVNFYLIKSGDQYIAVDAGANRATAEEGLRSLEISVSDIVAVFLTHAHGDHTGALELFSNADVYVGQNGAPKRLTEYIELSDGESVEILNTSIRCIATPGHTDSSVCYLINGKYLFVGDTLSLRSNQVGLFNSFFNKSDQIQMGSIEKLSAFYGVKYIFTAHYGYTDNAVFPSESR